MVEAQPESKPKPNSSGVHVDPIRLEFRRILREADHAAKAHREYSAAEQAARKEEAEA